MTPQFTHDYMIDLPSLLGIPPLGNTIAYVGFTGSTGDISHFELQDILNWVYTPNAPAAPHGLTVTSGANANTLSWHTTSADDEGGYYVERATSLNGPFTRIKTLGAGVTTFTDTGLTLPTQYYYRVQQFNNNGSGGAELDSGYSNWATGAVLGVAFPNFADHTTLAANGNTTFPASPSVLRLTNGQTGQASSAWYTAAVGTGAFSTTFTLQDHPGPAGAADSVLFVIQNDPGSPGDPGGLGALGHGGGAGGYGPADDLTGYRITNSIGIKFDLYTGGSHNSSTGLFTGGQYPGTNGQSPGGSKDILLNGAGIALNSADPMLVTLTYDGGTTLTETVKDTATNAVFSHVYTLGMTLAQIIGGNTAFAGFTAGTGGEDATQDILNWSGQFTAPVAQPPVPVRLDATAAATTGAGAGVQVTLRAVDANGATNTTYTGTVHFSSSDGQAVLPGNYTFTTGAGMDNGVHTFTIPLATIGTQSITAYDTAQNKLVNSVFVTVTPGATSTLGVTGFPALVLKGTTGTFTVTAKDAFGNTTPAYTGTVHLTSSDPTATFTNGDGTALTGNNYTFTAADNGTHTFKATLNTVGSQSITATDTATATITGTESGISVQQQGTVTIDFSGGFASHTLITANGNTTFPASPPVLRLTDGGGGEASSAFYNVPVSTGQFNTTFTFRDSGNASADSLSFVLQDDPRGLNALGGGGGQGGYAGITNSIAIKFDLWTNGTHVPTTGLFINGQSPSTGDQSPPGSQDVTVTGINFASGDPIQVALSYDGAFLTETLTDTVTKAVFSHTYTINIAQTIGGYFAYAGFTGGTGGATSIQDIVSWTGTFLQAGIVQFNFPDFSNHGTLTANANNQSPAINLFPSGTPAVLQMTDNRGGEATSAFDNFAVGVGPFSTAFTLQDSGGADGVSFVIQADPRGTAALGNSGGDEGYGDTSANNPNHKIVNSLAVKFDLFHTSNGFSTTGLFTGGASPGSGPNVEMTSINLASGDPFQVTLAYDGAMLTETVVDTLHPNLKFSTSYALNLAQVIGGNSAYVGFTAGTGGVAATQKILNWSGQFSPALPTAFTISAPATAPIGTPVPVTVTPVDQNNHALPGYFGTVHFTSSDPTAALPADYAFKPATDATGHSFAITLNTVGNNTTGSQSITVTDATSAVTAITATTSVNAVIDFSGGLVNPGDLMTNGYAAIYGPPAPVGTFASHQDIGTPGNPAPTGSATFSNGAYTLTASGSDIWDNNDHFQYVYEPLTGDGQIVARVLTGATAPDYWTKAGVMFRTSLAYDSANELMMYTPNTGHQEPVQQWRDGSGGGSGDTGNHPGNNVGIVAPVWLKLVRTGNTFTGYWAPDSNGSPGTWTMLTEHNTVMPTTVYVGLALTAHSNGNMAKAAFDHVTVTGTTGPLPAAPVARITEGGHSEAGSLFTKTRVPDAAFTTSFVLKDQATFGGGADSMSFVLQNDPNGPKALGGGGGAGGYQGIANSIAVKFDLWTAGTHAPTTGLFVNGQSPASDNTQDVAVTGGISFLSGDPIKVTLTYNGTTLTEALLDTVTGKTFTYDWLVNIPQILGGNTAYAGFTGGTGGAAAIQDIQSWTYQPIAVPAVASLSASLTLAPNLVTNGDFEKGDFSGWMLSGMGVSTGDANLITGTAGGAVVHGGTHAGQFGPGSVGTITQTLTTTAGASYNLDFWVSNPIGGTGTEWLAKVGATGTTLATLIDAKNAPTFNYTHYTFTFTATSSQTDIQFGFAHPPDWFYLDDVSVTPTSLVAGTNAMTTVTALDAGGHRVAYTGTVHITTTDPLIPDFGNYTFMAADNGQHVFTGTLVTAGPQTVTFQDVANSSLRASVTAVISPAAAFSFVATASPSTITAGGNTLITVTAKDVFGNVATGYSGTVHFTSNDTQAVLPTDATLNGGTGTFTATLKTAGSETVTATDTANSLLTATANVTVNPAAATSFTVTANPSTVTAGNSTTITVTAKDQYGNVATGYTGTVHLTSGDGQAVLPADASLTNGTGTFTVTLKTAGSQTVTATDTTTSSITGAATVTVNPSVATHFQLVFPSAVIKDRGYDLIVTALDAYGNVATGYTGTVHFTSSDGNPNVVLPADYTFLAGDGGTHTFHGVRLHSGGHQTLAVTDTLNASIFGMIDVLVQNP
jgi:hypothetical protein